MAMHGIEVDAEVLAYLKDRAEPFVDTPNSVLRRELLHDRPRPRAVSALTDRETPVPVVPAGTPKALAQLLQVAHLVTQKGVGRPEATKQVARFHAVAPQTINDKYGRQAGFDAVQFDKLLVEPGLHRLRSHLRERFSRHRDVIDALLGNGTSPTDSTMASPKVVTEVPMRSDRQPLTNTMAGYLCGHAANGDAIVVWHEDEGRTGYRLYWKDQWYDRFPQAEMEGGLGIPVRTKRSGTQEGYPAEAVVLAAWRYLVTRYNAGDPHVEYSHTRPANVRNPLA